MSVSLECGLQSRMQRLFWTLIHSLAQDLVHSHHMNPFSVEDGFHRLVAADVAFVFRILQVIAFDISPKCLHGLRP